MSEYVAFNVEALKNTMEIVEEAALHQMWNQHMWITTSTFTQKEGKYTRIKSRSMEFHGEHFCNTAACFAGWSVLLDGWRPRVTDENEIELSKDGETIGDWEVELVAMEILGLGAYDAATLFESENTLDDLRILVNDFVKRAEHGEMSS